MKQEVINRKKALADIKAKHKAEEGKARAELWWAEHFPDLKVTERNLQVTMPPSKKGRTQYEGLVFSDGRIAVFIGDNSGCLKMIKPTQRQGQVIEGIWA